MKAHNYANNELREQLAAYAHEAWSGWMKYMFSKCAVTGVCPIDDKPGTIIVIPTALYDRWIFQMETDYNDLPEDMKPSDRDEADKMLAIMKGKNDV